MIAAKLISNPYLKGIGKDTAAARPQLVAIPSSVTMPIAIA